MAKVASVFGCLKNSIFHLSVTVKRTVFKAVCLGYLANSMAQSAGQLRLLQCIT